MSNAPEDHNMDNMLDAYEQLCSIKGINFTGREIDVIACILHGRVTKKIAIILAISYKTVGTHISKIMSKIGCRSQEGIIDFIESSDKYKLLRQHYINLLVKSGFRQELNNINDVISKQNIACLIVVHGGQSENEWVFNEFCEYLKLAGALATIKTNEDLQPNNSIDYVLHCYFSKDSILPSIVASETNLRHVLVASFGQQAVEGPNTLNNVNSINLYDYDNLYFFVFAILKKLLPNFNIEPNIINFKKLYAIYINSNSEIRPKKSKHPLSEPKMSTTSHKPASFTLNLKRLFELKNKKFWLSCFLVITIMAGGFFFNHRGSHQKLSAVVWNLPRQDHDFIGRKELLTKLQTKLHPNPWQLVNTKGVSVISVCAGLGGVGKTQLALQYIHNTKQNYTLKAWFFAENIDQLKQQYIDLALELGFRDETPSFAKAQLYVKEWLAKHPGWLLVYDNVNSYDEIKEFLPRVGGSIILTSRQQKWPNTFAKLDVDVMTQNDATQLLDSILQRKITLEEQGSARELIIELGYLPLAIAQAGAYIKQNAMTIAGYLSLYREHEMDLLIDNILPEGVNSLPIAATWNVSLDAMVIEARANHQPPWALHLLNACAYLAPDKIPEQLLLAWFKAMYPETSKVELLFAKLIGQLWRYSMISKDEDGNVTIHRLVQTVVRYQHKQALEKKSYYIPITPQWFNSLLNSAHAEFIKKTTVLEDESRRKKLLPHMQSLLGHYKRLWPNSVAIELFNILSDLGDGFLLIGGTQNAKAYYERALIILEQNYGRGNIKASYILDALGNTYRQLGDLKQGQIAHEQAFAIKEKYYGPDHIEIAKTLDQLGRDYRVLGDAKQAIKTHERALTIKQNHYKKDNVEVALTLDQLGRDYCMLRNFKYSKELHERALLIKEAYYGDNHTQVATTLDYLGRAYVAMEDFVKARKLLERAVAIKEQHYDKSHVEIAITNDHLARAYRGLGYIEQAVKLHDHSVKVKENHYGRDHIEVANTIERLGRDYLILGKCKQASNIHERVLAIKRAHWGEGHIEVAFTLDQLARDFICLKDVKQAKAHEVKAIAIRANSNFKVSPGRGDDLNIWGEN